MKDFQEAIAACITYTSELHSKDKCTPSIHDIDSITSVICELTGIGEDVVFKRTRKREILTSRQLIQYFAKDKIDKISYEDVGDLTGGKTHATVINSIKTVNNLLATDNDFRNLYYKIERELT